MCHDIVQCQLKMGTPPTLEPPHHPLPKPTRGRYHLVRFIRSDRQLDVFGERFRTPPEATYEYVRATIDVARQTLCVYLDSALIDDTPTSFVNPTPEIIKTTARCPDTYSSARCPEM
jgi:hypothetical protein